MILTAGTKNKKTDKRRNGDSNIHVGFQALTAVLNVVILLSVIFCIANARIVLNNKIDKLDEEARKLRVKISRMRLEAENLRMRREKLSSWTEISRRIAKFDLKLRAPRHTQIRKLAIVPYNLREARDAGTYSAGTRLSLR
jgi:cell division protein FtsL